MSTPDEVDRVYGPTVRTGGPMGEAVSVPEFQTPGGRPVRQIGHAPLIQGGQWQTQELMAQHAAAGADVVFGIALHPNDYDTSQERAQGNVFLDFIAATLIP